MNSGRERAAGTEETAHVLVFPFPIQGHINPMLQFSKRLASKGLKITVVITTINAKLVHYLDLAVTAYSINVVLIDDGSIEGDEKPRSLDSLIKSLESTSPRTLSELIQKFNCKSGAAADSDDHQRYPAAAVKFVIYDSVMPWALDVAKENGIDGAPFFTQSYAVNSMYLQVYEGRLAVPVDQQTSPLLVSLPSSIPLLRISDLPSFFTVDGMRRYRALLRLLVDQFTNCGEAEFVFVNSFDGLEIEEMNWMASRLPVKSIGPTIPSMSLDKRLEDDKAYGISLFEPDIQACTKWLDNQEPGSVLYVSFGSLAQLEEKQMLEIATGIKNTKHKFLWVVRATEESKLPRNFREETSEQGLIVTWCPQLAVLAHQAVGCFVTHCGWNSTLEAMSLGVPMVAMPHLSDQLTNAKYIQDVWQVGVRVRLDDHGIVTRQEIEHCVAEVMEGRRAEEMERNAAKWKKLAKDAMGEGGSSDKNIYEFVRTLLNTY